MSDATATSLVLPRVRELGPDRFLAHFLTPRQPVIVTGEVPRWPAFTRWTWDYLDDRLGHCPVEVFDDWFEPGATVPLHEFLVANIGRPGTWRRRYVRWFSRNRAGAGFWADEAFTALRGDWQSLTMLPSTGYVVPARPAPVVFDPVVDLSPYRALFISAAGARTRLHVDPWKSSAVLCGIVGEKKVSMWPPELHDAMLAASERGLSGEDSGIAPAFVDMLRAGEVVFIPGGWWHEVDTISDAVSVTWNFVHRVHAELLRDHVSQHPDDPELEVLRYFLGLAVES